jgi:hypothetical protein
MLLRHDVLRSIEAGRVEAVYRRWAKPRVKQGSTLRTAVGVLQVVSVDVVDPVSLSAADAAAAGLDNIEAVISSAGERGGNLYRIGLRHIGPDPRVALREAIPGEAELAEIRRRLDRLDAAGHHGAWTLQTIRLIAENPGVRAEDLAGSVGREKMPFKLDIRKLKELGLTESLNPGYRLSPRGKSVVERRD